MSARSQTKKAPYMMIFHIVVVFALTFGIGFLEPVGLITPYGMKALGIFMGMLYGWIAIDMSWPSIMALLACIILLPDNNLASVSKASFGNSTTVMVICILPLLKYWTSSGMLDFLGHWCMSKKFLLGHPWRLTFMIMYLSYILGVVVSNMPGMLLCWGLAAAIAKTSGVPFKGKWMTFVCFGVTIGGSFAAVSVPWKTMATIFMGATQTSTGVPYNVGAFSMVSIIYTTLLLIVYLLIGRFILKIDVSAIDIPMELFNEYRNEKLSFRGKEAACTVVMMIIWLFAPPFLPKELLITTVLSNTGMVGVSIIIFTYLGIRYGITKDRYYNVADIFSGGTMWSIVLLVAGCMAVISNLSAEQSGIMASVELWIMPLAEKVGAIGCVMILGIILGLLTQVLNNTALGLLVIPVFSPIIYSLGMHPAILGGVLCFTCQAAWITPAASTLAAVTYGMEDMVDSKLLFKYTIMGVIVNFICLYTFALPIFQAIMPIPAGF